MRFETLKVLGIESFVDVGVFQQPGIVAPFQHVDLTPYITSRVKA